MMILRIINAALFFSLANHTFTVVEIDAVYTKPFCTEARLQTFWFVQTKFREDTSLLQGASNKTPAAIFQYKGIMNDIKGNLNLYNLYVAFNFLI